MSSNAILKKISKEYPMTLFYIFGNLLNAIFLRLFTTGRFQVRSIFFDIGIIVLLLAISLIIKKKRRKLFYIITSILMVITCLINSVYYNYYGSFVSISLLATSVFVKDFGDVVVDMVVRPCDLIYLWLIIAIFVMNKKDEEIAEGGKNYFVKALMIAFISFAIGSAIPPYNSFSRLYKLWNRVAVVNSFGPYVYQIDDIVQSLRPTFNNLFGYDKALKDVSDYYKENSKKPKKNDYTGIFEGKNVIAIHAESLQTFAMDLSLNGVEVTPNLNRIASEGLYFNNFYAQVGVGTSSDTEFTYATGLLPANNGTVFVNYYNNKFITMQNLLKQKDYYVFSMHGNVGDFWNREAMHLNMGYDKFYSKSSFVVDEEIGLGLSDSSFFRQVIPMIDEIADIDGPYYGTLITLSNHTPWRDIDKFNDYDVSMSVAIDGETVKRDYLTDTLMGRYLKSVNYMDAAIGKFFSDMEDAGLLDDTVVIIYGDHDARLGKQQFSYMYNYDVNTDSVRDINDSKFIEISDYDYELMKKVPFIIWSKDLDEGKVIDKPMGMIDVMPTLGNMLGVYNKYSLGKDIMATKKEDAIVVFKDGSFITDKIYYSAKNGESYMIKNTVLSDDYIATRSEYADKIIEISNDIITYNLIDKIK